MSIEQYLGATCTLLAVINPVVSGALLSQFTAGLSARQRAAAASKVALAVLALLLAAALGGQYLLQSFGISMDAFRMVGGVIVAYLGFLMISGRMDRLAETAAADNSLSTVILFAASPGTIATVMTLATVHDGPIGLPRTALVATVLAVAWTWLLMVSMGLFAGRTNKTLQRLSSEFMGLILITMGLQFVLDSYKHFMSG